MPVGTSAYVALANVTLGSSASSVTFSSISQGFRDLILVVNGQASTAANLRLIFNGDSGANYTYVTMYGTGSGSGSSFAGSNIEFGTLYASDTVIQNQIMDYSATDKHKTVLSRANNAANLTQAEATRWASTSAITSIACSPSTGTFNSGSTFALYGISA